MSSLDPAQYFRYSFEEKDRAFTYPASAVAVVVILTILELTAFLALGRPWREPWHLWRLGSAFLVLSGWSIFCLQFVMHMPGYVLNHHIWLLSLTGFSGLLFLIYLVKWVWERLRASLRSAPAE